MRAVRVIGQGEVSEKISAALKEAGFAQGENNSLAILAGWRNVEALYAHAEDTHLTWVLLEESSHGGVSMGPVFGRGGVGCFSCYISRRRSNGGQECRPLRQASADTISKILQAVTAFANGSTARNDEQLEMLGDGIVRTHVFLPLPNCQVCSALQSPRRALSLASLVGDRIGIVHEAREITGTREPFKSVIAFGCRTDAFSDARALNFGMAVDESLEGARERSIAESIERYCGALVPNSLKVARAEELDAPSVDPFSLGEVEAPHGSRSRFSWVRSTSLSTGKDVWVPASAVYVPYVCYDGEAKVNVQSSVGLAAGRTLEEAIHHGLAEIVERDSCLRAWRYGLPVEKILLPSFALKGLHLARIPSNSGLQVVTAFLEQDEPPLTSTGLAALPSLADAVRHAALEAVLSQMWIQDRLANGDGFYSTPPRTVMDHALAHAVCPRLVASRSTWLNPTRVAGQESQPATWTDIISRIPNASFVDLTTPDVEVAGIKVVRVLIPGRVTTDDDALHPRLGGCTTPHPFG